MRYAFILCFFLYPLLNQAQDFDFTGTSKAAVNMLKSSLPTSIVLHGAEAEYSWITNGSNLYTDKFSYYGDFFITSNWSIASVPFQVVINNQTWQDIANDNFSNASLRFDRDIYLDMLKNKMRTGLNAEQLLGSMNGDPVLMLKKTAGDALKKDLDGIDKLYDGGLKDKIGELGDLDVVFAKDMVALRQQFLNNDYLRSLEGNGNVLTELVNRKNTGQPVNAEDFKRLETEAKKLKGIHAMLAKIEEHRNKWQSSGLLNTLKQVDLLRKSQLEEMIKNPNTIIRLARERFNLNGIQKFFLKINKLNIGQNTLSTGNLSAQHLLNKGINTEFLNNNKYLMMGFGKLRNLNSVIDQGFTSVLQSNDGMMKMASVGLGKTSSPHSHVSVMSFDQTMGALGSMAANTMRTSLVTTFSNEMHVGSSGVLVTEVSRSATSYSNFAISDTTLESKSSLQRIFGIGDLLRNMAFSLKYDDEWEDHELSYGIHVGKTANGYVNPGSPLLSSGAKNVGVNLRKFFFHRSLQASVRSEIREYDYSDDQRKLWRNFYSVLDIKWKLGKGQSVGLRYIPNKMIRIDEKVKTLMSSMSRLSLDANVARRIGNTYYRNNVTLSRQGNSYFMGNDEISALSLTVSSFQNIVLGQKLMYLNINYDHVQNNSDYVYLNSSFIVDAGTTYMLLKKLSVSSALSYNSVEGWYKQAGIKQTISGQISERFNVSAYVDVRKNLVVQQPLMYGPVRADISIHYIIKK